MIDLTIEREYVHESLMNRSNLKRDMLKEFSNDDILREAIRFGILYDDGKLEEGIGSGADREVPGDFIYCFGCRSGLDLVQNIV